MTFEILQLIGFAGVALSALAYLPQIIHLIKEKCSAGISRKAYMLWLLAALAVFMSALFSKSPIFILLTATQVLADSIILVFSYKYSGTCEFHAGKNM